MKINLDDYIKEAFLGWWSGGAQSLTLDEMKAQLHKNLKDQVNGYWSGHSAYGIMVHYGFLIDQKPGGIESKKKLTRLGEMFMQEYTAELQGKGKNNG